MKLPWCAFTLPSSYSTMSSPTEGIHTKVIHQAHISQGSSQRQALFSTRPPLVKAYRDTDNLNIHYLARLNFVTYSPEKLKLLRSSRILRFYNAFFCFMFRFPVCNPSCFRTSTYYKVIILRFVYYGRHYFLGVRRFFF